VAIPVRLYAATERKNIKFNLIHAEDKSPIKYLKWCPACEQEVTQRDLVRAFEYRKGEYVVLSEEEMESIPGPKAHVIEILDFVALTQVDPVYFDKTFFLEPREGAEKAYALLREAMESEKRVALCKVAIRAKETLGLVRAFKEKFIILETMFWADEVRKGEELVIPPPDISLDKREREMARTLIQSLSTDFRPEIYENRQREALAKLIEQKIEGQEVVRRPEVAGPQVIDLMEALRKSVEKAKSETQVSSKKKTGNRRRKVVGGEEQDASPPPAF
jgi:DNA end-binding protein Ku